MGKRLFKGDGRLCLNSSPKATCISAKAGMDVGAGVD